jgi:hypothetical protein
MSWAKPPGISLSRAMENATREVAMTVMSAVFAVANSATALKRPAAAGLAFSVCATPVVIRLLCALEACGG